MSSMCSSSAFIYSVYNCAVHHAVSALKEVTEKVESPSSQSDNDTTGDEKAAAE